MNNIQNIFSSKQRTRSQSMLQPPALPGGPDQQKTEQILKQQYHSELQKFSSFLSKHYAKFDYKINRCNVNCIKEAQSYKEISDCERKCGSGVKKFSTYVDNRIQEMQTLLNECVDRTRSLSNSLDEVYRCYMVYNQSFDQLKLFIQEESMFYE